MITHEGAFVKRFLKIFHLTEKTGISMQNCYQKAGELLHIAVIYPEGAAFCFAAE